MVHDTCHRFVNLGWLILPSSFVLNIYIYISNLGHLTSDHFPFYSSACFKQTFSNTPPNPSTPVLTTRHHTHPSSLDCGPPPLPPKRLRLTADQSQSHHITLLSPPSASRIRSFGISSHPYISKSDPGAHPFEGFLQVASAQFRESSRRSLACPRLVGPRYCPRPRLLASRRRRGPFLNANNRSFPGNSHHACEGEKVPEEGGLP